MVVVSRSGAPKPEQAFVRPFGVEVPGHRKGVTNNRDSEVDIVVAARELMTPDVQSVRDSSTLVEAAQLMRDLDVGSLPICGEDDKLKGMLTDRDIVVRCIAQGGDPAKTRADDLAQASRSPSEPMTRPRMRCW